jgi:hypothetical protein
LFRSLCEPSPAEPDEVEARIEFDAPYLFAGVSK